jgi:formylglycine-generating enzyme required for sulfatase activity
MKWLRFGIPFAICIALVQGQALFSVKAADHAKRTFRDCAKCPEMVMIPGGTFIMGSPEAERDRDNDEGQHKVTIAYSFAVSKGPIAWTQWEACVKDAVCDGKAVDAALSLDRDGKPIQHYGGHAHGNHPVVGLSWFDAKAFVGWLNKKTHST